MSFSPCSSVAEVFAGGTLALFFFFLGSGATSESLLELPETFSSSGSASGAKLGLCSQERPAAVGGLSPAHCIIIGKS